MIRLFDTPDSHLPNQAAQEPWLDSESDAEGFASELDEFQSVRLKLNPNSTRIVFSMDAAGLAAEQYRRLRRKLVEHFPKGAVLLVTGSGKSEGKTLNSINLAWCMAEGNMPTLLAELDVRQPQVAKTLGVQVRTGIEGLLTGGVEPAKAIWKVDGLPLYVAAASRAQKHASDIIKAVAVKRFVQRFKRRFPWIVIDSPPVMPAADVSEILPAADAAIFVVRVRKTPEELLRKSVETLGSKLWGVLLNEATLCQDSYYRYLSGYYAQDGL